MKRIIGLCVVASIIALGTNALAAPFGASGASVVIYRVGGDASGNTAATLTNRGNIVYLDEYLTNGTYVQSIMLRTNYFGANSPLIGIGSNFGNGLITRSTDGRFILVTGFGAVTNQFSFGLQSAYGTEAPRVIGLVDGNGNMDTTTTLTNGDVDGVELRSAVSTDGTNIWFGGSSNGARYMQRTNLWFSGMGLSTNLPSIGNVRQVNIFNGQLYFSTSSIGTNFVSTLTNSVTGQLPTSSNNVVQVGLPGVTNSIPFFTSPWAFYMCKLNASGSNPIDTIYVADAGTNNASGSIRKFSLVGSTFSNDGSIRCSGAVGLTGQVRISGSTTNVDLWIISNVDAGTGNDGLHVFTDTNGYHVPVSGSANVSIANSATEVSWRGIAFAPTTVGDETFPSGPPSLSAGPLLDFFSTGNTGCSATETDTYSIANFGASTMNWSASDPSNWVSFLPSNSGSLPAGGSVTISAYFNGSVTSLPSGTNTTTITFTNNSGGFGTQTRAVRLVLYDQDISPTSAYVPSGQPGGPFSPANKVYTVYNGSGTLNLIVTNSYTPAGTAWLTFSATNVSSLAGCTSTNITISVNSAANSLAAGSYSSTVIFSNTTAHTVIGSITVTFTVGGAYFCDDFSTYTQNAQLQGQKGWVNNGQGSANEPYVANNSAWLPAITGAYAADEPYKNLPQMPAVNDDSTSNGNFSVFAGMVMTVTSAPPASTASPARMLTFYQGQNPTTGQTTPYATDSVAVRDTGTNQFVFGIRDVSTGGHPWVFGTNTYNYGQPYRVILHGTVGNTNSYLYVAPASETLNTNTAITSDHLQVGFEYQNDQGIGSFGICNTFGSGGGLTPVIPGVGFSKICINTNYADVYNGITESPVADFTASPTTGTAPLPVNFTSTSSGPPDTWAWDFGDSGTSTAANPSHTYTTPGVYDVKLIVANPAGSSTNTKTAYITVTSSPPTADFTATPTSGLAPLQVVFTDTSSGSPTSWAWDFDNNGSTDSTGQNPTNTYSAGTYTVRLIACNGGGCSTNTKTAYISALTALQSWQNFYGVTANGSDSDNDGMSNTNEFLAGFNPNNNGAYLHIISIAKSSGTNITVTYLGASGDSSYSGGPSSRTNVLEFTTGTANGSYTNAFQSIGAGGTNVLNGGTGTGAIASFVDTNGASGATKYYRVRVLVP